MNHYKNIAAILAGVLLVPSLIRGGGLHSAKGGDTVSHIANAAGEEKLPLYGKKGKINYLLGLNPLAGKSIFDPTRDVMMVAERRKEPSKVRTFSAKAGPLKKKRLRISRKRLKLKPSKGRRKELDSSQNRCWHLLGDRRIKLKESSIIANSSLEPNVTTGLNAYVESQWTADFSTIIAAEVQEVSYSTSRDGGF